MAFKQHLNIVRTPFEFIHFASKNYTFRFANYTIPDVDGFKYDADYPKMEEFFPE